ncbi:hypothetical protein BD560DRAFT_479129 [Blakeslea trispora]|nr:hypothetical protein BD560DRAFT_479129 [Blakeslea trispora]
MIKQQKDNRFASQISAEIPSNAFTGIVDVNSDGFCGFRTLVAHIFDDENEFLNMKYAMRDQLLSNYNEYLKAFGQYKKTTIDANTFVENRFWFMAPDYAQIAACTFGVPVAVYGSDNDYLTFLLVLDRFSSANYKPGPKPLPLLMHFVNRNHWITLELKSSIKIVWPAINISYYSAMANLKKKIMSNPSGTTIWHLKK